jgi:hypothetical protein
VLRALIIVSAVAVAAAPLAAQVDTGRGARPSYAFDTQEGWLGIGLSCSLCSFQRSGTRGGRWSFSEPPSVFSVDAGGPAGQAGLRAGDTLLAIDGTALTTPDGGRAFGSIRPGQELTLRYRRDGREAQARLTAGAGPYRADMSRALARQVEVLQRAQERRAEQMQRQIELTQRQLERQHEYMARAMAQLERARAESLVPDSARFESLRHYMMQLDSAAARWRGAESLYGLNPPPAPPAFPLAPAAPEPPIAAAPAYPLPPAPPTAYAWHHESGPVRFSGRLGDVIIEARGRGRVTATVVSDSEVVVTSGDVSVRLALRPAAAPKAPPRARPARPPED